jgi:hypothetical protein
MRQLHPCNKGYSISERRSLRISRREENQLLEQKIQNLFDIQLIYTVRKQRKKRLMKKMDPKQLMKKK